MQIRSVVVAALAVSALAVPSRGATLDDLRRSLAEFRGVSSLRVKIDTNEKKSDGKEKKEGSGSSVVEDDGNYIRLVHQKSEVVKRQTEKRDGLDGSMSAGHALELMNYGPVLLKALDGATLTRTSATTHDGAAATLFEITPAREKSDKERFVKSFDDTLLVWIGAGGVPLAAERTQRVKAKFLVISFEALSKERYRFQRAADRLLVTKQVTEMSAVGLGQNQSGVKTATLTVLN